jgi:hypothetical protein
MENLNEEENIYDALEAFEERERLKEEAWDAKGQ